MATSSPAPVSRVNVSRNPRPRPIRRARLSGPAGGVQVLTLTVTTPRVKGPAKVTTFNYFVEGMLSDFGRAFRLHRFADAIKPGEPTYYDTCVHGDESICGCPGFEQHGMQADEGRGCKHISSLSALVNAGRI